jgi:CelD/BcsL family acetyltransferase involved in cellulose biosynthesis
MNISAPSTAAGPFASDCLERSSIHLARIEMFDDFAAAEQMWLRLERALPLATPYQRFDWLANWYWHIGRRTGVEPLIALGLDRNDAPMFILPFIRERRHGCHIARFCGGSHSNLNMAIWRPDVAVNPARPQVVGLLEGVAAARSIDLFALLGQPSVWCGVQNPFATLSRQPSPDDVYVGTLDPAAPQFKPRLASRMRKKQRRLMQLAGFHFGMAETPNDVDRFLAAFWPQKAARFAKQGIRNVFENPGVTDFIRAACLDGLAQGRPAIELYALEGGGEIFSVVGGVSNRHRFSVMFNSITAGAYARMSPGILLMDDIVADCAKRGMTSFDLGAGHASYKSYFCSGSEQRFDCFVPFSARGRVLAAAYQASDALRRSLKATPTLMNALQAVRRWTIPDRESLG